MRKYIVITGVFILIVVVLIWMNRAALNTFKGFQPSSTSVQDSLKAATMIVVVTPQNDFYHKPGCLQIGRHPRQILLSRAIEEYYEPCPYCFKKEKTPNESNQTTDPVGR